MQGRLIIKDKLLCEISGGKSRIHYILTFNVKNNKFKYTFTNFIYDNASGPSSDIYFEDNLKYKKIEILSITESNMLIIIDNIIKLINNKNDDNW